MKNSILNGAGPAYDTLIELQTELIENDTQINNLLNQIGTKANINNPTFTGTVSGITKGMVGLSNVDNTTDVNKPISTATQNALNLKANVNNPTFTGTVNGITKAMIGLSNVDNTSDTSKPISTSTQTALDLKANILNPVFTNNITVNNTSTFNKGITITETSPDLNISLRSTGRNSQLNLLGGANAGNYNPITADSDSLIVYHGGAKDTGALNIINWSNSQNGLKLTRQLTKVHGNFEVSNGSFVGSPIFRPTGNSAYGLGNNVFNTTALTSPIIYNGIANGTGNNASYTDFNVSFNSWYGTGFVCTANNTCNAYLDHTNGNFTTKGNFSGKDLYVSGNSFLSGNLSMANNDITSRDITARALSLTGNINMPNNSISARELYLSANLNMQSSDIFARSLSLSNALHVKHIYANEQIHVNNGTAVTRITNDAGIAYIQSGTELTGGSRAKLRFAPIYSADATMTIDHINKRVGICNDTPTNPLSVGGNANINGSLQCSSNITQNNLLLQGDSTNGYIRTTNTNSTLFLGANNNNLISISNNITTFHNDLHIPATNLFVKDVNIYERVQSVENSKLLITSGTTWQVQSNEGSLDVVGITFNVGKRYVNTISGTIPLSIFRSFRVNSYASTTYTVRENILISCSLYKNGTLFKTFNNIQTSTMGYIPTRGNPTMVYNFELYAGNCSFSFTPDYEPVTTVYELRFTSNGSFTADSNFVTIRNYIRTNTAVKLFIYNKIDTNYTMVFAGNSNYIHTDSLVNVASLSHLKSNIDDKITTFDNAVQINHDLKSINFTAETSTINNLTTNNLTTQNVNATNFSSYYPAYNPYTYTPAYYIDGNVNAGGFLLQNMHAILSSVKIAGGNDDAFIVAPGYILVLYRYANYIVLSGQRPWAGSTDFNAQTRTIDNSNGTTYAVLKSKDQLYGSENQVQSFRLYYKSYDREITLPIFS
jgi:hypothetical protein